MIERNSQLVRQIESSLRKELALQEAYLKLLHEEQISITKFNAERVEQLCALREKLNDEMSVANESRKELMGMFPDSEGKRLTELIRAHCHPDDVRRLIPLAENLRSALKKTRSFSGEFKQLANFSLNLVNGAISILWSATQNITRSYTPNGKLKESFQPAGARLSSELKQA